MNRAIAGGPASAPGVSDTDARSLLLAHGVKATRQRRNLARLVFGQGNRHFTAKALAQEAQTSRTRASLATVYNVLNLFAQVGLLRTLAVRSGEAVFDTDTSDHSHFLFEDTGEVGDIRSGETMIADAIAPPEGYEVARIDVVVRLRPQTPR